MNETLNNICIVSVHQTFYSETFIRAHIERLPARIHHIYGGYMPLYNSRSELFLNNQINKKIPSAIYHFSKKRNFEAIEKYLRENKIEAVLCEYGPTGVEMMDLCEKIKIPLFVYFHGYDVYRQKELKKYESRYQELFRIAQKIFVVSKDMQNRLMELGAPPDKLVYNPCGADTDLFLPCNPSDNAEIFFAAGRFEETKCPHNTIQAFALVAAKFPAARLVMAGTGSLLKSCRNLVAELKIKDKVEFSRVLSHKEIAEQMRESRAFVQHSVTTKNGDKEGTPVAIMEASACALPIIATKHGGISDVVIDGETGILVDEHDIKSMSIAMMKMVAEPETASALGRVGYERVKENFSQKISLERLWSEIEKELLIKTK